MFVILLIILGIVLWYGAVFVTGPSCSGGAGSTFSLAPPPHWSCNSGYP
jgi:hypothetical protein